MVAKQHSLTFPLWFQKNMHLYYFFALFYFLFFFSHSKRIYIKHHFFKNKRDDTFPIILTVKQTELQVFLLNSCFPTMLTFIISDFWKIFPSGSSGTMEENSLNVSCVECEQLTINGIHCISHPIADKNVNGEKLSFLTSDTKFLNV